MCVTDVLSLGLLDLHCFTQTVSSQQHKMYCAEYYCLCLSDYCVLSESSRSYNPGWLWRVEYVVVPVSIGLHCADRYM